MLVKLMYNKPQIRSKGDLEIVKNDILHLTIKARFRIVGLGFNGV